MDQKQKKRLLIIIAFGVVMIILTFWLMSIKGVYWGYGPGDGIYLLDGNQDSGRAIPDIL